MIKRIFLISVFLIAGLSAADAQTGTWSGKLDIQGMKLSIVFHLDDANPAVDSPDQGAKDIPTQIERGAMGKLTVKIPSLGAIYEGQWLINKIVGTFTQMNMSLPLTLTPGENKPRRPQTPAGPFPYDTEEVSFTNGDVTLNGTLILPEGYSRKTPALVMVTGSGQQNRDEEIFGHRPFAVIADALGRAGIATLRYDDRGFSGYEGNINDCTIDDFKEDALSGIRMLRERFDKVGVIGHSEGGTIAMMLAADNEADYIISLAGMSVSGAETLVWQNRIALLSAGLPESMTDAYCKLIAEAFHMKANGGRMPVADDYDLPEGLKQNYQAVLSQIQTPYMSDFLTLDTRPLHGNIKCPVLALNGTKDMQVDAVRNLEALRKGLPDNPKNQISAVEGVNHLFQNCETGSVNEYKEIEETFSPAVLEKIVSWLNEIKQRLREAL